MTGPSTADIGRVFREEYGRAVAVLTRVLGDIDVAEDMVQDAFSIAVERWPGEGIPPSPAGWIITTARRRAIDTARREAARPVKHTEADLLHPTSGVAFDPAAVDAPEIPDDRLRLMFTCCHPALAPQARVALTLRLLGGLTTMQISRAFLVPETTMGQRISRAKRKIRDARIPFRIPSPDEFPERLDAVRSVLYLVYTEGHTTSTGPELADTDLCSEAVRLARLLAGLVPDDPETTGLLALMLLGESRRAARTGPGGDLVLLADQDRSRWDRALIDEGQALVRRTLRWNRPGPYQIQAAIAAVHADAPTFEDTDWAQIVALYDLLMAADPTPVVALHRAVALAEVEGPAAALGIVDRLDLERYHVFHAVRADLLARLGRITEASEAYTTAAARTENAVERAHLLRRCDDLRDALR
ncbi:RNA polymerase subunit sigma-24 [Rhodococcus pyridinivorans KG-16]|uniref:RNA polymerase subunit sigma-24 n=1 Tax=Rhodococcus pyridinivorans KG-16 TaxID=1441730 RepID=A0A0V9UGY6_9NOCA|nr:RNA polymerase sigma factor [Rhodococcus pyridinivorans]KSZ57285.1 RNA polymerase subunit sigma-24 [Rhodococcus pyridinivorans KG-16]